MITWAIKLKAEAFLLVALSALYRIIRGKAEMVVPDPKTAVIVNLTTNLGDMIMTTPIFHAIKKKHPGCAIIVVGGRKNKELLFGNPDVDSYLPMSDFWITLQALRRMKPDIGIAMNPSPHEVALLFLARTKGIAVFANQAFKSRAFRALSSLVVNVRYEQGRYVPKENLKLANVFGITSSDVTKHLSVSEEIVRKVAGDLRRANVGTASGLLVCAPGAGQTFREWPVERFAEVMRFAKEKYNAGLAIAGGPSDTVHFESIQKSLPGVTIFDGTTQTIEELKALVSLATAVVANDSGIAYIAEAFNVPAVIIVGVSDAQEHPKGSPRARVVTPESQPYVIHSLVSDVDAVDVERARKQFDSIPVAAVSGELEVVWRSNS